MATRATSLIPEPRTYAELRRGVEAALLTGTRQIEQAKVRTYWESGNLISVHLLLNEDRATYGQQVVPRLARDLGVADRLLYQCLQFARTYPILHARAEFTWAHYRLLIQVPDEKQRRQIEAEALKKDWVSAQLETRVRELALLNAPAGSDATGNGSSAPTAGRGADLLTPKRGTCGLHRVVARGERLAVDLGFKIYRPLDDDEADGFTDGTIVQIDGRGTVRRAEAATKADLFTYPATLRRLVDGDTLLIELQLLPRCIVEQKLRLRGLDCPEMATAAGKTARRFTETALARMTAMTLFTTKPDKYDRYLADVFLTTADGEIFLNNALLETGHAVRKEAWQFGDWEDPL